MKLIILTHPELLPGETDILNRLFAEGLSCLHLRKPSLGYDETRSFIEAISHQYHSRIVIHDHYQLAHEFALKGVHRSEERRVGKECRL